MSAGFRQHLDEFLALLLVLFVSLAFLAGCAGPSREFLSGGQSMVVPVFDDYRLKITAGNRYSSSDKDPIFLEILQEYEPLPADTIRTDSVRIIEISDFCVRFDCLGWSYCPGPDSVKATVHHFWSDGVLSGPHYYLGAILIPSDCEQIEVSFLADLTDRKTGERTGSETVSVMLGKKTTWGKY